MFLPKNRIKKKIAVLEHCVRDRDSTTLPQYTANREDS